MVRLKKCPEKHVLYMKESWERHIRKPWRSPAIYRVCVENRGTVKHDIHNSSEPDIDIEAIKYKEVLR